VKRRAQYSDEDSDSDSDSDESYWPKIKLQIKLFF
jgi:hypothetical protein